MKHKLFSVTVFLAVLIVFVSCTSTKVEKISLNKVYVTNTNRVDLLPVTAITEPVDIYQLFEGTFGDKSFNATLYLQADSTGITILMLNDMMIQIGSIVYDGNSCTLESGFFPKNLKAEYIVLDLQNAYCDLDQLKDHYKKYGLDFTKYETCVNGQYAKKRELSKNGEVIETIVFQDGNIAINNSLRGYSYYLSNAQ